MDEDWHEWSKYIKKEVGKIESIKMDIGKIKTDIAVLQLRAGMWGLVGGALPSIGAVIYILTLTK